MLELTHYHLMANKSQISLQFYPIQAEVEPAIKNLFSERPLGLLNQEDRVKNASAELIKRSLNHP